MPNKPIGLVLAGGKSNRMGGKDKGMLQLNGRTLCEIAVKNLQPQVSSVVISANRNFDYYKTLAEHVVADDSAEFEGPLMGILSVMNYLESIFKNEENIGEFSNSELLIIPCDMPLLPADLGSRMQTARQGSHPHTPVIIDDGKKLQPLCCLLPSAKKLQLDAHLKQNNRKVMQWMLSMNIIIADFSSENSKFININTAEDLLAFKTR